MKNKDDMSYMGNLYGADLWLETKDTLIVQLAEKYFEFVRQQLKKLDDQALAEELLALHEML